MTPQRIGRLKHQLQEARYRLNALHGEFAAPLRDMTFVATKDIYRMSTNGACIYFDPDWLQQLRPVSLDFMLVHQLMHIKLGHINRPQYYKGDKFHLACDIVSNAHLYEMGWRYETLPRVGMIFYETFYPKHWGTELDAETAMVCVPFDPAAETLTKRRRYMIDCDTWWDQKQDGGESGTIVLSPADRDPYGLSPGDNTGGEYSKQSKNPFRLKKEPSLPLSLPKKPKSWEASTAAEIRFLRAEQAAVAASDEAVDEFGDSPAFLERLWQQPNTPTLDWRKLLNTFVQEDVFDYSFSPPDRRMQDSPFFLPDYSAQPQTNTKEVLFMVDTSGSVDDEMLFAVYSELIGALNQFHGTLTGMLGFFDTAVYPPTPFADMEDLQQITPIGGGGTDYHCIFRYVRRCMPIPPSSIVIFTDGQCEFPEEAEADNIPVLWLFTEPNMEAPWGRSAYVEN